MEQTANGIWRYEEIPPEERRIPTLNVAQSELKLRRESPLIGDAVHFNIENLLRRERLSFRDRNVLLLGYGATGSRVAAKFQAESHLTVFDTDDVKRVRATNDGFRVASELSTAIADQFLVIGCTGRRSVSGAVIARASHRTWFVNASSKRLELDHEELRALTRHTAPLGSGAGTVYELLNGRQLFVLANGFPVNFFGDADSVPDSEIAFIDALLFEAARYVAETPNIPPGIVPVPKDLQDRIEEMHDALR